MAGSSVVSEEKSEKRDLYFEGGDVPSYWKRFSAMLAISVVIATIGLYRNSGAVVIAAMLIAPLMTPILGIATAIVMGWSRRMLYLLAAVGVASVATIAFTYIIMYFSEAPRGMQIPAEVAARTDPGLEELMVALAAGIAGAYVQMRKEEMSLLPGVAIGVSLVPPLSASGMLLYFGSFDNAWEAALLYLTNLAAIILAACAVFFALGRRSALRERGFATRFGAGALATIVVVAILTLELSTVTLARFREARDEEQVVAAIRRFAGDEPIEVVRVDVLRGYATKTVEIWLIVDVPLSAGQEIAAPAARVPETLRERNLRGYLLEVLGQEADVVLRVQLRYAGLIDLRSGLQREAPQVETESDDE